MSGRWIALWSRGLRSEPGRSLAVAILVFVTVLVAASVPRLLSRASDDALHAEIAAAPATVRNLELVQEGRIAAGDPDPLHDVAMAGAGLELAYPPPIASVIASHGVVVETPLWHVQAGTALDSVLNLRIQQGVDTHIRLVAGRPPTGTTKIVADPTPGASKDSQLYAFEMMMPSETATKLGLALGGRLILDPEPTDPLAARRGIRIAVDLVGTYEVIDPTEPFWMADAKVAHSYIYALSALVEYLGGTMLLAPEAYPDLFQATLPARLPLIYRWRSYVAPASLQSDQLDALAAALRRARTIYPPSNAALNATGNFSGANGMSPAELQTGLLGLIGAHQARWQSGATILTVLWTGAGLVILASLALVAETIARRRRAALSIVGRRGASPRQVASAILSESTILVIPAALLGLLAAMNLTAVPDQRPALIVAALVAFGAVAFIAAASRRDRATGSAEPMLTLRRRGSGRLVAEALVVFLAIVGAALLRGRTELDPAAAATGAPGEAVAAGADPFLAAAPALVGLAAGLVAVRLLPLILGLLARLVAGGRGLTAVLGLRRAARDGSVAAVLVVALTATTVGTFASVLLDQIGAGASSAAWETVGADFQLSGTAANLAVFQAHPPAGVGPTAAVSSEGVGVSTGGARQLLVADPTAVAAVAVGTPADPQFPAAMLSPAGKGPLPAIVSRNTGNSGPIALGQEFSVRLGGTAIPLRAVALRDGYPSLPAGQAFVVISSVQLAALGSSSGPPVSEVLARGPGLALATIQAATVDLLGVTVRGEAATEATLRDGPAVSAVSLGVLSAAVAVLVYGLLTIILSIALDTASRRRETARLQIMGLATRQTVGLVLVEFAPAVIVGVAAGLALGLGLVEFVAPGLGLPAVLGVAALAGSSPDLGRLAAIAAVILALIIGATLLSAILERQTQLASAVRD